MFKLRSTDESLYDLEQSSKSSRAGKTGILKVSQPALFKLFADHAKMFGEISSINVSTTDRDYDKIAKVVNGKVGSTGKVSIQRKLLDNLLEDHTMMFDLMERNGKWYCYIPR